MDAMARKHRVPCREWLWNTHSSQKMGLAHRILCRKLVWWPGKHRIPCRKWAEEQKTWKVAGLRMEGLGSYPFTVRLTAVRAPRKRAHAL
eukprot:1635563-Amphidinium_carterae.1